MMTEAKYRADPSQNYSLIADFSISQDHALMKKPPKPVYEQGHGFESIMRDRITGSDFFNERFVVFDHDKPMPPELPQWLEEGVDLSEKYVYKKDGDLHGTYKTRHDYLDVCMDNPGKMPLCTKDWDMLNKMADNLMICELKGITVAELLSIAEWQVPIFWERNGVKKKALLDCAILDIEPRLIFDLKTSASIAQFHTMARQKYWIQDIHYSEGAKSEPMIFLVAPKDEPHVAQAIEIEYIPDRTKAMIEYQLLCQRCQQWIDAGKPPKGWKEPGKVYKKFYDD